MGIKKELGLKIKRMRTKLSLTQEELAEKIDISQRTLAGIEIGEKDQTTAKTPSPQSVTLPPSKKTN